MIMILRTRLRRRVDYRRVWIPLALAIMSAAGGTSAGDARMPLSAPDGDVLRAEDRLFDADVQHDTAAIADGFADEAIFVHANGATQTKADYLRAMSSGEGHVHTISTTDRVVKVFGDVAVTRGTKNLVVGNDMHLSGSYLTVYIRRNGRWLMLDSQSSPAPRNDPPQAGAISMVPSVPPR